MSRQIYAVCLKCFFSLVLLSFGLPALAQSSSASVNGLVRDTSQAYIPNAYVKLINTATGTESHTQTNKGGSFTLPSVMPGQYTLQIERDGFATTQVTGIILNVGDTKALEVTLKVGSTNQTVNVDGSGLTINTTDGSVSTVIDRTFVANMPLNGRSFQDLILLTPGVVTQSSQNNNQAPGYSGEFSVNGQRTDSNVYTVDGVNANTGGYIYGFGTPGTSGNLPAATALGTTQSLISVDALQEFRVASSSYSAEFGLSPGGQFSFNTRSGTNEIHGTAFDYLRNNYFDANDWFNDNRGAAAAAERQNDFGGTLGGPIWIPKLYNGRNKSFFFVSYEGLRLTQPTAASALYVPALSLRQAAPAVLQPVLNAFPVPTGPEVTISCNGTSYPCPTGQPVGTQVAGGIAPFVENYALPSNIDSTSLRLDERIADKYSIFFRFSDTPSAKTARSLSILEYTRQSIFTDTFGLTAAVTRAITDEFRLGYTSDEGSRQDVLDTFGGAQPVNLLQLQGLGANAEAEIAMYPPGYSTYIDTYHSAQPQRAWNVVETVTISHGNQTLKAGFTYRRTTSRLQEAAPFAYSDFNSVDSVLANSATSAGAHVYGVSYPAYSNTALFLQDELRVRSRLSFSLGLRWEVNPPPTQTNGTLPYIVQGILSDPSSLTLGPANTRFWKTTYFNYAPRVGTAYRIHTQPGLETVLRAGGGIFFDTGQENSTQAFGSSPGQGNSATYSNASYPLTSTQVNLPLVNPPVRPYSVAYYFPSHLQLPYTLQWSAALEQALGKSQSVTLTYVGSSGRRLLSQQVLPASVVGPHFSSLDLELSGTTSSYNSMQIKLQRTLSRGLQVLASYNWAHSIDFGSQSLAYSYVRGNSDFDLRHNFNAAATYDLHTSISNRLVAKLMEGWGGDARFTARTGFPITLNGNAIVLPDGQQSYSGLNLVPAVPVYLYGAQCGNLPGSECPGGRRINPAAFSLPTGAQEGNAPRNFARGLGENQVDVAVRRTFPLVDKVALQFRAEAFNVLNHPNFGRINNAFGNVQFGEATNMLNQSLGSLSALYQQGGPRSMQFALKLIF